MQLQIIKEDIENFVAQKKAEIEEAKRERKTGMKKLGEFVHQYV